MPQTKNDLGSDRVRVRLDFSREAYDRLQEISEKSGFKPNAETIRKSLRLLDWYLEKRSEGYELQIVKGNVTKKVKPVL